MRKLSTFLLTIVLSGCTGWARDCDSTIATSFGADWLVVQYKYDGRPMHCWKLRSRSVTSEHASDGIYWADSRGNMVHISGWYNYVQVANDSFGSAAAQLNVDLGDCQEDQ